MVLLFQNERLKRCLLKKYYDIYKVQQLTRPHLEADRETVFYRRSNSLIIRFGSRGFRLFSSTHQPGDAVLVYLI